MQSQLDQNLEFFSTLFVIAMAIMIVVPYLRGRSDLLTFFNLFLGGSMIFIGFAGWFCAGMIHRAHYTADEYSLMYAGVVLFYVALWASYRYIKWPRRMAGRYFRKWPVPSFGAYFAIALFALVLSVFALFRIPIPFIGQIVFQVLLRFGPFALVFSLLAFRKDSFNPVVLIALVSTIGASLLLSLSFGGGRRLVLAQLVTFAICFYWRWLRYKKPRLVLPAVLVLGVVMMAFENGLSQVRWRHSEQKGVARAVQTVVLVGKNALNFSGYSLASLGQDSVEVTLYTIHNYLGRNSTYEPQWFYAPYCVIVNPIPRSMWEEKPKSLGHVLPMVVGKEQGLRGYGKMSWGVTPVAQGLHDGGLLVVVLYGAVFGMAFRWFDEMLLRQPENPFYLGFFACSSAHIIGLARGSIDNMTIEIIASIIATIFLAIVAKILLGSGLVYPRTDHILDMPRPHARTRSA